MHFVHLGIFTEFSVTESIVRIPDLVKAAAADDMPALAITDLSNLHAAVKFYRKAMDKGCLLYTSPSPRDRQKSRMPSSA